MGVFLIIKFIVVTPSTTRKPKKCSVYTFPAPKGEKKQVHALVCVGAHQENKASVYRVYTQANLDGRIKDAG